MGKDETRLLCMPCFRTLACIAGIALATGLRAAPLTTAAGLAAVNRGENTEADGFAITATLVRVCSPEKTDSLCVADGSGYTTLRLPFYLRPAGLAAGCSLRLSGTIDYEAPLAPAIVATNCTVLTNGPAPTPRDVSIREVIRASSTSSSCASQPWYTMHFETKSTRISRSLSSYRMDRRCTPPCRTNICRKRSSRT